jgi:hypothetical protein
MTDEAVFADRHELADEGMGLHPGTGANYRAFLNLRKRADETIVANTAIIDVARLDYLDPRAEFHVA